MSDAAANAVLDAALDLLAASNDPGIDLDQLVATIRAQQGDLLAATFAALMLNASAYLEARIAAGDKARALRFPILIEEAE